MTYRITEQVNGGTEHVIANGIRSKIRAAIALARDYNLYYSDEEDLIQSGAITVMDGAGQPMVLRVRKNPRQRH